jgi:hypothetical protein
MTCGTNWRSIYVGWIEFAQAPKRATSASALQRCRLLENNASLLPASTHLFLALAPGACHGGGRLQLLRLGIVQDTNESGERLLDVDARLRGRLEEGAAEPACERVALVGGHLPLVELVHLVADEDELGCSVIRADQVLVVPLDTFERVAGVNRVHQDEAVDIYVTPVHTLAQRARGGGGTRGAPPPEVQQCCKVLYPIGREWVLDANLCASTHLVPQGP